MKRLLFWSVLSAVVLVLVPWILLAVFPSNEALGIAFLLCYGLNPVWSILMGVVAGRYGKSCRLLCGVVFVLFMLGAYPAYGGWYLDWVWNGFSYLVLSFLAMVFARRRKRKA